jgi:hypothetical protein
MSSILASRLAAASQRARQPTQLTYVHSLPRCMPRRLSGISVRDEGQFMGFFSNLATRECLPADKSKQSSGKRDVRSPRQRSGLEKLLARIRSAFDAGQQPLTTDLYQEKRQHPRVKINRPLRIKGFGGAIRGKMKDVSVGGALLYASDLLRPREIFSIRFDKGCGCQEPWSLLARVVRCGIENGEESDYPHRLGIEFIRLSEDQRECLRTLISERPTGSIIGTQTVTFSPPSKEGGPNMEQEKRFVDLLVSPDVYPTVRLLVRKKPGSDDEMSTKTLSFHKEMWRTLAKYCKQRVTHGDISSSQELVGALNAMADAITREVSDDEKRERNKDAYESFADFVASINARTDLDTIRKAQMIHDRAYELKLA